MLVRVTLARPRSWMGRGITGLVACGLLVGSLPFAAAEDKPTPKVPVTEAPAQDEAPKEGTAPEATEKDVVTEGTPAEPEVPAKPPAPPVTFPAAVEGEAPELTTARTEIEATVKEFVDGFNAHDAKRVADLYTAQAEMTDLAGKITRGQEPIQGLFANLFTHYPEVKIQFTVDSLRFLSPNLAIEDGTSVMTMNADPQRSIIHRDRYTVTHIKQDGKWLIAAARDWAPQPLSAEEHLKQLEWLVGEWVDENSDVMVHTNYHWSSDKRYLFSRYQVHRPGSAPVEGLQRIGWDPLRQQMHSWTFDTAGGYTEGLWSRVGDQWIIKMSGMMPDGRVRSSTNVLTKLGPDHATYQSRDRVVGAEVQPDLAAVPIVRKPPEPSLPKPVEQAAQGTSESAPEKK